MGAIMTRNVLWLALVAGALMLNGCESKSNLDAPREFFSKHKIGSSADYAVIKWGNPEDHVVTVHGFMDDLKSCQLIADALNKDACNETGGKNCLNPFSCQPLNH
jgi:hypothetical protein